MYPQSLSPARQVDFALMLVFIFSAVVLLILTCTACWFIFRYHHKRNPAPSDIRGNMTVEILWTIIPSVMVMGLFYFGWTGYQALRTVPENAMQVYVTAKMFSWTFTYPNGKHSSYLAVPVNTPVKLNMHSVDVIHSLFVPAFRIKMDTVPGMATYAWFSAEREGEYDIYCAEYCGTKHSSMLSTVKAMSKENFESWLKAKEKLRGVEAGHALLEAQGCFSCHDPAGHSAIGPSLTGLYGAKVTIVKGGKEQLVTADDAYIEDSIMNPADAITKGYDNTMPPYQEFTDEEMDDILDYLRSVGRDSPAGAQGHKEQGHEGH